MSFSTKYTITEIPRQDFTICLSKCFFSVWGYRIICDAFTRKKVEFNNRSNGVIRIMVVVGHITT